MFKRLLRKRQPGRNFFSVTVLVCYGDACAYRAKMLPTNSFQQNLAKAWPICTEHDATRDEALGIFGSLTQVRSDVKACPTDSY